MSEFDITPKKVTRKYINTDAFRIDINNVMKRIMGEFIIETEFDDGSKAKERMPVNFHNKDFAATFEKLLPNDDTVVWTNPYKSFRNALFTLVKDKYNGK